MCIGVVIDADSWAPVSPRARAAALHQHESAVTLLKAAGWRVLPASHGTTLASQWPLAGGRLGAPASLPSTTGSRT